LDPNKRNKAALLYSAPDREEKVTFEELRKKSNQYANVLKKYGVSKGDRVFLFMPRSPEFYVNFFGILKTGAIAGPLFEAFMEQAVR
ncbi:AMP-binding protein, partial [Salmonella enterica]|uniref:AMP-binding protein n=1 Tax=Salmonella enterica TaxID=28901 RepID=UPI000CB3818A